MLITGKKKCWECSELQEVGDDGGVVDQVWNVAHWSLWSHLRMMGVMVMSLVPVHWLGMCGDHLIHPSPLRHSSIMCPSGTQAVGLSEALVRPVRGGREVSWSGNGLSEWTMEKRWELWPQGLPLVVVLVPKATVVFWGAHSGLLVIGRGWRRRHGVAVNMDPVGVDLRDILTAEALFRPKEVGQRGRGGENWGGSTGLHRTPVYLDGLSGLVESAGLYAPGSSVLKPDLRKPTRASEPVWKYLL